MCGQGTGEAKTPSDQTRQRPRAKFILCKNCAALALPHLILSHDPPSLRISRICRPHAWTCGGGGSKTRRNAGETPPPPRTEVRGRTSRRRRESGRQKCAEETERRRKRRKPFVSGAARRARPVSFAFSSLARPSSFLSVLVPVLTFFFQTPLVSARLAPLPSFSCNPAAPRTAET